MKKEKDNKLIIIFGALALIISLWLASWYYTDNKFPYYLCMNPETISQIMAERGAFGDKFGFVNSLFSGLALTGIIISIYFQQKELSLQREELIETREEFKDQNFQTTFFNLVKTQREIYQEITSSIPYLKNYRNVNIIKVSGGDFFIQSKLELIKIHTALNSNKYYTWTEWDEEMEYQLTPEDEKEDEYLTEWRKIAYTFNKYKISKKIWKGHQSLNSNESAKLLYTLFINKYEYAIGHYFRHLFHILKFLDYKECELLEMKESDNEKDNIREEFQYYSNFIQAQMNLPELFLIFYNSLAYPKLQNLLIKYNFLENLNVETLIDETHKNIEGMKLKSRLPT